MTKARVRAAEAALDKVWRQWDKMSEKSGELHHRLLAAQKKFWAAQDELEKEQKTKQKAKQKQKAKRTKGGA